MRILFTGATGYLGSYLLERLEKSTNFELALIMRNEKEAKVQHNVKRIISTNNSSFEEEIISFNPDVVLHLAAII